jgi:hypothetical protein
MVSLFLLYVVYVVDSSEGSLEANSKHPDITILGEDVSAIKHPDESILGQDSRGARLSR